jgi:toxin HigB-1
VNINLYICVCFMEIKFRKQYLEDLYQGIIKDKAFKSNPNLVKQYVKTVNNLRDAQKLEILYQLKSLRFKALTGDLEGLFSVRINDQYRLIFEIIREPDPPFHVQLLELEDISKHYE